MRHLANAHYVTSRAGDLSQDSFFCHLAGPLGRILPHKSFNLLIQLANLVVNCV